MIRTKPSTDTPGRFDVFNHDGTLALSGLTSDAAIDAARVLAEPRGTLERAERAAWWASLTADEKRAHNARARAERRAEGLL